MPRLSLGMGVASNASRPTITPTTNQFPGISASNDYIAVNYGNQNIFLFGTNTVVQRNYGYDPEGPVWDNTSVNGNNNRIALLDWNFITPGSWSFTLENQSFGVAGYAWKNNSTNSSIIPTGGWFGYVPFNSNLQAGTTTLILSAVPVSPTPTPTRTPTPTVTPTVTPTITPTPTSTPIPAIPGIDTNYVQDIYLTNSDNPGMNGVWTNVSQGFGFPAWVNYSYNGNAHIFAPNNGYSGGDSWTFYDTDQGEPIQPSNPSTNRDSIPTSGWTQNVSISAHTWKYGNNNYLLLGGLIYDDTTSFFQMPANGLAVTRQDPGVSFNSNPYTSNAGTFITYSNADGGTFNYTQNVQYEDSYFQYTMATKTNSPSARGLPAYGYISQTHVTGNLIISPILYVPLSAASINVSGVTFADQDASDYFYNQPFVKDEDPGDIAWGTYNSDDNGNVTYYSFYKRWEIGVYYGNTQYTFAYNYASAVSGIPLSGWVMSQEFISVTGYPRITKV